MTVAADKGTSMLAKLTADVMGEKVTAAARTLTPVAAEPRVTALPQTKASFPNDMPQEVVETQVRELTRVIGALTEARDALATLAAMPAAEAAPVDRDKERKQREFEADLAAKERAAQAGAFKEPEPEKVTAQDVAAIAEPVASDEWTCPDHGKAGIEKTGKNGTYIGCPDCNKFKR